MKSTAKAAATKATVSRSSASKASTSKASTTRPPVAQRRRQEQAKAGSRGKAKSGKKK